jgi:methanogenic corrinoid protein MtbC1
MPPLELAQLSQAVIDGDVEEARRLARAWGEAGNDPLQAVERGFSEGIRRVGVLWEEGEYFLPELVQGAEAMKAALEALNPWLGVRGGEGQPRGRGRIVIGTVQGDLHDIGKSLVGTMLSAHGFEVRDLGSDVPVARFVEEARRHDADVVGVSALLTTTMVGQRAVADAVRAAGLARNPRILIGGAPTTPEWAAEIGAIHAENALRAVAAVAAMVP